MSTREEYRQKMQAQLDEWKAELEKLNAKAERAQADIRLQIVLVQREMENRVY